MTRNVFCPRYSKCLDRAADNNTGWDCAGCLHGKEQTFSGDFMGETLFLWALFKPDLWRAYNEAKKFLNKL